MRIPKFTVISGVASVAALSVSACASVGVGSSEESRSQPTVTATRAFEGSCANITLHDDANIVKNTHPSSFSGVIDAVLGDTLPARWDDPENKPPVNPTSVEVAPASIYTPWLLKSATVISGSAPEQVAIPGGIADGTEVIGTPQIGMQSGHEVFMAVFSDTVGSDQKTFKVGFMLPVIDQNVFIAGCPNATDFPDAVKTALSVPVSTGNKTEVQSITGYLVPKSDVFALFR